MQVLGKVKGLALSFTILVSPSHSDIRAVPANIGISIWEFMLPLLAWTWFSGNTRLPGSMVGGAAAFVIVAWWITRNTHAMAIYDIAVKDYFFVDFVLFPT